MKKLIYKEFSMVLKPYLFIFVLLPALLLIPNYPYCVGFFLIIQAIFLYLNETRTNNDILFTSLLPISRNRIVLTKYLGVCFLQLCSLLTGVIFALLSAYVIRNTNLVGLDANLTLFGLILLDYGLFNVYSLPKVFKSTNKIGFPIGMGIILISIFHLIIEVLIVCIPTLYQALDGIAANTAIYRSIVFVIGTLAYCILTALSYKLSCKNFEKVGL